MGPPRKWKMWLLLSIAAYPVILGLLLVSLYVFAGHSVFVRLAFVVPLMSAIMVWIIMPLITRLFGGWLRK